MNTIDPTPAARPVWSQRFATLLQDEAELVILGLVLAAICLVAPSLAPWSGVFGGSYLVYWLGANFTRQLFAIAVGVAFLLPLTWLAWRGNVAAALTRLFRFATRSAIAGVGLLGAAALVILYCFLWPRLFPAAGQPANRTDPNWGINVVDVQAAGALFGLVALSILTRLCRRPPAFYLSALALLGLALTGRYFLSIRPTLLEVTHHYDSAPEIVSRLMTQSAVRPWVIISALLMPWATLFQILPPLLVAFYSIQRGFAWWKALAGWLAGWLLTHAALFLSPPPVGLAAALMIAMNLVLLFLLLRLPRQRFALERLMGINLAGPVAAPEAPGENAPARLLGHALVLLLAVGLTLFAVLGTAERHMARQATEGIPLPRTSPALVNAYEVMKPWFDKEHGKPLETRPGGDYGFLEMLDAAPRAAFDEAKPLIDAARVESDLGALQPALDAYIKAADADLCIFQEPRRATSPNWVNLRLVARALQVRANLRILQERPTEALQDIETNLKIAWLLNSDPIGNMIENLIGSAVRGIALTGAQNYYVYYRQNPAALEGLRALLARDGRLVRFDFPGYVLSRNDPGAGTIPPYFQLTVLTTNLPSLIKAGSRFYQHWANYDALNLATALEAWHRDQGRYPDRLEQLVPKYLAKLPLEPVGGQPYAYANLGAEFRLSYPVEGDPERKQVDFSSAVAENSIVRKSLDALKAKKQTGSGSRVQ